MLQGVGVVPVVSSVNPCACVVAALVIGMQPQLHGLRPAWPSYLQPPPVSQRVFGCGGPPWLKWCARLRCFPHAAWLQVCHSLRGTCTNATKKYVRDADDSERCWCAPASPRICTRAGLCDGIRSRHCRDSPLNTPLCPCPSPEHAGCRCETCGGGLDSSRHLHSGCRWTQ